MNTMIEDAELLRRYANGSQEAFAALVGRHLPLVYHAALRQCGNRDQAQDIAQIVFTDLARKAHELSRREVLAGWLHTSTRYAALQVMRIERRRVAREHEAFAMNNTIGEATAHDEAWSELRPVIDDSLQALGEREREAVLLRFFEGRPLAEVGARLAISEDAARMRVERALDKLQGVLARRGVTSTSAALSIALATQSMVAAPAGLVAHITTASVAAAAVSGGIGAGTAVTFMSMTKIQVGILGAIALAGAGGYAVQERAKASLEREEIALQQQAGSLRVDSQDAARRAEAATHAVRSRKHDDDLAALAEAARQLKAEHDAVTRENAHRQSASAQALRGETMTGADATPILDRAPVVKTRIAPKYPFEMQRSGIEGQVLVEYVVDADGAVQGAVALRSSRPEFEAAAVEAVSQWKYDPGQKGGRLVKTKTQQVIKFSVAKEPSTAVSNWF